ncbi:hypothetical protein HU200_056807 [Digitaria exilis]|uniref:Isopentenyl transferase n=1 Tax=Digitaria exilis TaxID=1010633 RepID=A0A835AGB1_9POAL|nr:hypothetical protein HU200_056807 [Digitaria exilis]
METVSIATASANNKVVVLVMGATATGKSKLAIDLALHFGGEVINSDKIEVHDGLDVVTNKVTAGERRGVAHHLIGGVGPDADYTAADFCRDAARCVESVLARGHLPIIAGGSNTYMQAGTIRRLDVTEVLYLKVRGNARDPEAERDAWEADVAGPAAMVVGTFLAANIVANKGTAVSSRSRPKMWMGQAFAQRKGGDGTPCVAQLETEVVSPGRGLVGFEAAAAVV